MSTDIPVLHLAIIDVALVESYKLRVAEHNKMVSEDLCPNSGFDLLTPNCIQIHPHKSVFVDMGVKGSMKRGSSHIAYQIFPRSSISKTPLMLSNHVGIIDSGYRGNLMAAFRNIDSSCNNYEIEKHTRLVQICLPSLEPFHVKIVNESELSSTSRGDGGFGSTGV